MRIDYIGQSWAFLTDRDTDPQTDNVKKYSSYDKQGQTVYRTVVFDKTGWRETDKIDKKIIIIYIKTARMKYTYKKPGLHNIAQLKLFDMDITPKDFKNKR